MKKMKMQLRIEKTTISRLTNLNTIKGGDTTGTLDCQIISEFPPGCPPPITKKSCPPCALTGTEIGGMTTDCP
ncbi:hypothetical protein [Dokdonia sp.]|uniref:hypothetical protein n=1 Tax=Dokdonia sp. TaxID=2024995 RepID=UPI00326348F7